MKIFRLAALLGVLLGLYAAAGFLLAPWLAQRYLPDILGHRLGRAVAATEIRVNPFLLTLEARQATVEGRHGRPLLAVERLFADASLAGLLRGDWSLGSLVLEGMELHVVLRDDGGSNLADVAARWRETSEPSGAAGMPLSIDRLAVLSSYAHLTRRGGDDSARLTVGPLSLRAQDLTTRAEEAAGTYELAAALPHGGSLESRGGIGGANGFSASGQLSVRALRAGSVWPLLPPNLPLSSLRANADFSARFEYEPGGFRLADFRVAATGVSTTRPGRQEPLLEAARVEARDGSLDSARRTVRVGELAVAHGQVHAVLAPDEGPTSASRAGPASRPPPGPGGWEVDIANLLVEAIDLKVDAPAAPFHLEASALSGRLRLQVRDSTADGVLATGVDARWDEATLRLPRTPLQEVVVGATKLERGRLDLAQRKLVGGLLRVEEGRVAVLESAAVAGLAGQVEPPSTSQSWSLLLDRLEVSDLGGRYATHGKDGPELLRVGSVDARMRLEAAWGGARPQVLATGIAAEVRDGVLAGAGRQEPVLRLASANVTEGRFDLAQHRVAAGKLVLRGSAHVVRGPNGAFQLGPLARARQPVTGPGDAAKFGWRYAIDLLDVPSMAVELVDHRTDPALRLQGTLQAEARNVGSATEATVDARLALAGGGRLSAAGTVAPGARQVRAQVQASGIALAPLQPLLQRFASLAVRSGTVSASADVAYGPGEQALSARGSVGISGLVLNEAVSGDHFLSWEQVHAQGVVLDLGARKLSVGEIDVQEPRMKIVVSQDRQVNLLQVLAPRQDAAPAGGGPREASPGFGFELDRVRLHNGEVAFADHSLVLPFATTVMGLQGTIVDISNQPSRRASVQASGAIEPYGSARVEGTLLPFDPRRFTDLQVVFENVRVPPLSPYTATFAGRKVASGKLWLDLRYHVEDGELRGSNEIRIADFKLGERVEAAGAMDVPLELVVGLLTDANGQIRLSVPVSGELGDARFSVGSAIRQALASALQRIVTAPFRALGKLFGGEADALARIEFLPGSARLRPEEREKLDSLTDGLRDRPGLHLVVTAPYHPQLDADAIRQEKAARSLAQALGRRVAAHEEPGPFSFDHPATRQALEDLLRQAEGHDALREFGRQDMNASQQDRAKRYEAMLARLAAAQPVDEGAARLLAVERARRIAEFLQRGGVDPSRVRTGRLSTVRPGADGEIASQLQLAAAGSP